MWAAVAGALVLAVRERPAPRELVGAAEPGFLVFVLGLGVVVAAASDHGLARRGRRARPPARACRR